LKNKKKPKIFGAAKIESLKQQPFDPGLTQKYSGELRRAINKDGSFNVHHKGSRLEDHSFYQFLITIPWIQFHIVILLTYIVLNSFFAGLYMIAGMENLQGASASTAAEAFINAFFFSIHTYTTVGLGTIAPKGIGVSIIAAVEAITGLMSLALATGLLFGRFSKPSANIGFSLNAIIAPYQDKTSLQFRIVNRRKINLLEMEANVLLMMIDKSRATPIRKYFQLPLERQSVYFFPLPWTIVHPIDKTSPLHGKTPDDLARVHAEILILIKGFDETFGQTVHARYSYRFDEIIWGAKFEPAFSIDANGDVVLHLDDINKMERVEFS
jgi:inward rectifier potassium channel